MKSRIEMLCETDVRTQEDKKQIAEVKKQIADQTEISVIMKKIIANTHTPSDVTRVTQLYKTVRSTAVTDSEKELLPHLANVLRKLGIAVD